MMYNLDISSTTGDDSVIEQHEASLKPCVGYVVVVYRGNLCRICGCSVLRYDKLTYEVKQYSADIDSTFMISTVNDKVNIHPTHMCQKCKHLTENFKKVNSIPTISALDWLPHSAINCSTCLRAEQVRKGGRPKRAAKSGYGRPKTTKTLDDIMKLDPRRPIPSSVEDCVLV